MPYNVEFSAGGEKSFRKLPNQIQEKISPILEFLSGDPRPPGSKKLKGMDAWRVRLGDYRIIYEIRDSELLILVIKIAHRSKAY